MDKILDDVRSSVSDNFKRVHLLQRKDIHNIERIFKLEGGQRHHDDATSVAAWVEEVRGMGMTMLSSTINLKVPMTTKHD